MCIVVAPAVVLAGMAIATATTVTSTIISGVARKRVADQNQAMMDQQAAQVRAAGEVEAEKAAMQGSQMIGKQKAAASASGADVQGKSVLDVLSDSRWMSTWNRDVMRRNTDSTANAYQTQGKIAAQEGNSALLASGFNAAGQVIGGAASMYGAAYKMGEFPTLSRGGDVTMPNAGDHNYLSQGLALNYPR
jgi:hypothetical protein